MLVLIKVKRSQDLAVVSGRGGQDQEQRRPALAQGGSEVWPGQKLGPSYSDSPAEDSSLELELSATKYDKNKELSFPSVRHS